MYFLSGVDTSAGHSMAISLKPPGLPALSGFLVATGEALVVQIAARLISAHQFEINSPSHSKYGPDGIFSEYREAKTYLDISSASL